MRIWILAALLPCALLAQTSPPRPADRDAFKKLPQRLDWLKFVAHSPQSGWEWHEYWSPAVGLPGGGAEVSTRSRSCSIPLLRAAIPKGTFDHISAPNPSGKDIDPKFILPTPPVCEDRKP